MCLLVLANLGRSPVCRRFDRRSDSILEKGVVPLFRIYGLKCGAFAVICNPCGCPRGAARDGEQAEEAVADAVHRGGATWQWRLKSQGSSMFVIRCQVRISCRTVVSPPATEQLLENNSFPASYVHHFQHQHGPRQANSMLTTKMDGRPFLKNMSLASTPAGGQVRLVQHAEGQLAGLFSQPSIQDSLVYIALAMFSNF